MMNLIQAIYFDLGKVLVDFDWNAVFTRLEPYLKNSPANLSDEIFLHPYRYQYECGTITTHRFFEWLKEMLTFQGPTDLLIQLWSDIFLPLQERIDLLPELKQRYRLGMISNTCEAHYQLLSSRYDFFRHFEHLTLSFQVGVMKPQPEIYRMAAEALGVVPAEALFIDDLKENIEGARQSGWNTLWILPEQSLRTALVDRQLL